MVDEPDRTPRRNAAANGEGGRGSAGSGDGRGAGAATPLVVYGRTTCEDTAVTRSRLETLGVPFRQFDIDVDPAAEGRLAALTDGRLATPTLVLGPDGPVESEPGLERLGELLAASGRDVRPPRGIDYHGELTARPIPLRRLRLAGGGDFSLEDVRGSLQSAVFLAHGPGCLACFGYAKQLGASRGALAEVGAMPLIVVPGDPSEVASWRAEIDNGTPIAADPDAAWKGLVAAHVGQTADAAILLLLDRFAAPRVGSSAADAGGLIDPAEAVEWLGFLSLECPECAGAGEVPWPDVP